MIPLPFSMRQAGSFLALALLGFAAPSLAQSTPSAAADSFSAAIELPSQGVLLRGVMRVAAGAGPHPTVVSLQGFPGSPDPLLPAYVQAAGFNGVAIYFRGQRSSDGLYSVEGTVEDARAMVAFLRSDSAKRAYRIDPKRIVLIGASAGTLATLAATAGDSSLGCVAALVPFNWSPAVIAARTDTAIRAQFEVVYRAVTSGPQPAIRAEGLVDRLLGNAEAYDLVPVGAALRNRAVLLVGAEQDATAPLPIHFAPLAKAIRSAPGARLRDTLVADGHNLPNTYLDVFAAIVRWLRTDCFR